MGEPNQIQLGEDVAPYLVGKVLHLPPPVDGDRLQLIAIPRWAGRGGVYAPCNDASICDVNPPVDPGDLSVEEGWLEEPDGTRTPISVLTAYVRR